MVAKESHMSSTPKCATIAVATSGVKTVNEETPRIMELLSKSVQPPSMTSTCEGHANAVWEGVAVGLVPSLHEP